MMFGQKLKQYQRRLVAVLSNIILLLSYALTVSTCIVCKFEMLYNIIDSCCKFAPGL